ncbi:MAG: pirin family protein [Deltaproteobacteria bacterium]|nr:pirin family protein [Deltaproteobacteria bacterium]
MSWLDTNDPACSERDVAAELEVEIQARPRKIGALSVGRVLPAPARRMVGPVCFLDHMGHEAPATQRVDIAPHPHIGLSTVTYLFDGAMEHRDSLGSHQVIVPGDINWMTAGRGVVHSERSPREGTVALRGVQLWVALPKSREDDAPAFEHSPGAQLPRFEENGAAVRLLIGEYRGLRSPVKASSPMLYADAQLSAGAKFRLAKEHVERAAYVVEGQIHAAGRTFGVGTLAVFARGTEPLLSADAPARVLLLGGEPLDGPRHIWWNFVSSSQEKIVDAAHAWAAQEFPVVPGDEHERVPAPGEPKFR